MTLALRWAAMRAILMFQYEVSQDSVHKPQAFWRERRAEAVLNRGPSAYQPNALPPGQTRETKQARGSPIYLPRWWRSPRCGDWRSPCGTPSPWSASAAAAASTSHDTAPRTCSRAALRHRWKLKVTKHNYCSFPCLAISVAGHVFSLSRHICSQTHVYFLLLAYW